MLKLQTICIEQKVFHAHDYKAFLIFYTIQGNLNDMIISLFRALHIFE